MSENDTVQKKLNLREPYAEALEEAAEEIYGSTYKQARVVEALLDQTKYQPDEGRIKDDLRRNVFANGPTVEVEDEAEESDEEESVEELSAGEKLSRLKELEVDRGEVVAEWLRQNGPKRIERSFVVGVIESEAGYSQSMAYNIARDALDELVESPFNDAELDDWADTKADELSKHSTARVASFAAFAGVDEGDVPVGVWFKNQSDARDAYQQALVRVRIGDAPPRRTEEAFEKLAELRPSYVDESIINSERELL